MNSFLHISVRYLQSLASGGDDGEPKRSLTHGRADGGEPEWPPSPHRIFQALVAASAGRWNERAQLEYAVPALRWLEQHSSPTVIAATGVASKVKCQFYVPDNTADLVVPAWSRGDVTKQVKRSEKVVRPTHLSGDTVHYVYALDGPCPHFDVLRHAARSITHLGWGIDMVAGDASLLSADEVAKLDGEVWRPTPDGGGTALRVPKVGTLDALMTKHQAFLNRLSSDRFKPVPPLAVFDVVHYRRATEPAARPFVAFSILKPDASSNRAFDTARRCRDVAGWSRHATGNVCDGWPFGSTEGFVHGHDGPGKQLKGELANERFMYLPIPSIERRGDLGNHVGAIRRVLIAAPPGFQNRIDWIRRRLPGQDLVNLDGEIVGMLNLLPTKDWVLNRYTQPARTWSTVTPVVWPGHDDRDARKAESILRKAFVQAGLAPELVAAIEELDWRAVGFRAGVDLAHRYAKPDHMNGRMYHVRVRFPHPVPGPLAVGAGRYRGFGLFAAED